MNPKILHIGICTGTNGLTRAFMEQSSMYAEIPSNDAQLNTKAIRMAEEFKPDIVFVQIQKEGVMSSDAIRALRNCGAWVVNWNGDVRDTCPSWMISQGKLFSTTLFTNMRDVREMRQNGLESDWLEIGYDDKIYCPEGEITRTYPIVFFGNNAHRFPLSQLRTDMCNRLKRTFPGEFGVYGIGPGADGNLNHSQPYEAAAYRFAKIAINVSHYEIERYSSDRMLRILGTGKPLCLAKSYPDMPYIDGEHLRTWSTLEELEELIRYHMVNEEERLRIVKQGNEYVKSMYTFDKMVSNLIEMYEITTTKH